MDFLAAIRRDSDRFYGTADIADPTRVVPSCPAWTVADIVWHLGEVHWFWRTVIEMRATNPEDVEKAKPSRPDGYAELVASGRTQADRMVEVLVANADDIAVWTWALDEAQHTVGFIRRHQAQEAAVHRWDIELAANGKGEPVDAEVATDAIDEFLSVQLPWCVRAEKPLPGSVHLHCTDVDGEWFIHADGRVETTHAKADAAIRGTASDLLLMLYKRVPVDDLEVIGDSALASQFAAVQDTE